MEFTFSQGLRTAKRIICWVWPGPSFDCEFCPGMTTQTSAGEIAWILSVSHVDNGQIRVRNRPPMDCSLGYKGEEQNNGGANTGLEEVVDADVPAAAGDRLVISLAFLSAARCPTSLAR